jgi:hypothetical protein
VERVRAAANDVQFGWNIAHLVSAAKLLKVVGTAVNGDTVGSSQQTGSRVKAKLAGFRFEAFPSPIIIE